MEYIILRDCILGDKNFLRGETITMLEDSAIPDQLARCLMKLDGALFQRAYMSFGYANWIKEHARDIDDLNMPLYPNLSKSAETVVLYLKDIGVPTHFILKALVNQEEYLNFLVLVDQFGQRPVE